MTDMETANARIVRRLYEEYLKQNRPELLPSLVSENVVLHSATEDR